MVRDGVKMFIGEYHHTMDQKGRIIVPTKFREELGQSFVITKGLDHSLFVYPNEEWKRIEEKLKLLPLTNRDARAFVRFFFAGAAETSLDNQGRILIPSNLRDHAQLTKESVIIGVSTRVEIWDESLWNEYIADDALGIDLIAEKMSELGI